MCVRTCVTLGCTREGACRHVDGSALGLPPYLFRRRRDPETKGLNEGSRR